MGYIDLYMLHTPKGGKEKILECWRALEDAVEAGEVRSLGVSNFDVKEVSDPQWQGIFYVARIATNRE